MEMKRKDLDKFVKSRLIRLPNEEICFYSQEARFLFEARCKSFSPETIRLILNLLPATKTLLTPLIKHTMLPTDCVKDILFSEDFDVTRELRNSTYEPIVRANIALLETKQPHLFKNDDWQHYLIDALKPQSFHKYKDIYEYWKVILLHKECPKEILLEILNKDFEKVMDEVGWFNFFKLLKDNKIKISCQLEDK